MRRRINRTTTVSIDPLHPLEEVGGELFAINWIDTRAAWLYNLYNVLAAPLLHSVGGRPLFKGTRRRTLHRREAENRNLLLVVRYPSSASVLDLLESRAFQLISVLRVFSVRLFSFVLHTRLDTPEVVPLVSSTIPGRHYAMHHFRSRRPLVEEIQHATTVIQGHELDLVFAGYASARLSILDKRGERPLPFVTNNILLFEGQSEAVLQRALMSHEYTSFIDRLETSYLAVLERSF